MYFTDIVINAKALKVGFNLATPKNLKHLLYLVAIMVAHSTTF